MIYLLDTNICIVIIKKCPSKVKKKMIRTSVGEMAISSIVLKELWYGPPHGVEFSEK